MIFLLELQPDRVVQNNLLLATEKPPSYDHKLEYEIWEQVMKRLITLTYLFVAMMCLPAAAENGQLRVSLAALNPQVRGDADIFVRVTISNPNPVSVTVPVWQVPDEDIPTPIFEVTAADGSRVPYVGALIKWGPEVLKQGVTFAPRSSRVFVIELSALYDIGNGRYRIDYSQDGPGRYDAEGKSARVFGQVSPVYVQAQERSTSKRSQLQQESVGSRGLSTTLRCSSTQITTLRTAVSSATDYATNAQSYFAGRAGQRYTTWFGVYDATRWGIVTGNFNKIQDAFANKSITIDCSCKKRYYAYVYANDPYRIYVCSAFWSAPMTGRDSKAGTLIHEMSHFTIVAGTSDYVYGAAGARDLAVTDPAKAIRNADSQEYFAENIERY